MGSEQLPRKLAAILYADVAGYSRLTGEDEDATHRGLSDCLDLIATAVEDHRGRVVHYAGDAVLAMFEAAVDVLSCAAHVQGDLKSRNAELPDDRRIQFRIGINLGDVIEDRGDIYGDGVNVAARLESLADPGGICISDSIRTAVGKKLPLDYVFMGEQEVKNIAEPVRAYSVVINQEKSKSSSVQTPILELPDKPSIAVLPFQNMSGDPEQEYFSDGITEDIITALSRSPWLFVIARNSSFAFRGSAIDVKQVAQELGVHYILEGSVRKAGKRVRVTAQLIDGLSGGHVWAEKYDGELTDIFDLQDEITRNAVASIQTQIQTQLSDNITLERLERPDVRTWDLLARAWKRFYELTEESLAEAEALLRRAAETDPASCEAHQLLAGTLIHRAHMGYASDWDTTVDEAHSLAKHAVALDDRNEYAHWTLGVVELWIGNLEKARSDLERAIELNPNCSLAYGSLGTVLSFAGESDESIKNNEIAIRSNPRDLSIFFRFSGIAIAHFVAGRYEEALHWARKSVQRKVNWRVGHAALVSSLAQLGRVEEAKKALADYIEAIPEATISGLRRLPFKHQGDAERMAEGLRIAGLPE